MTDLPEIVTRALALPGAVAGDLALFGGVLRCGTCGAEQPLGDVAAYLSRGWPQHCGATMTWVTLKLLAAERREVPEGYELAAVPSEDWRVVTGKLCARTDGRVACRRPSAAETKRGSSRTQWWPYCLDHLYGRWIESGTVMHWILREKEAPRG